MWQPFTNILIIFTPDFFLPIHLYSSSIDHPSELAELETIQNLLKDVYVAVNF